MQAGALAVTACGSDSSFSSIIGMTVVSINHAIALPGLTGLFFLKFIFSPLGY